MSVVAQRVANFDAPAVEIIIDGLSVEEPSRLAVWRQTPGKERTTVQGLSNVEVVGAGHFVDYLPPLGVPVTYMVDVLEGDPLEDNEATITVESATAWLQDALNPVLAVEVAIRPKRGDRTWFLPEAFAQLERATTTETVLPMGARTPVIMSSRRQTPASIPLNMVTDAAEAGAMLRELLVEATHLVLRVPPSISMLDPVTHLGAVSVTELPGRQAFLGGHVIRWDIAGTQSRDPRVAAYTALWTYDDVAALYEGYTYADLVDGRRYVDWQAHPDQLGITSTASTMGGGGSFA